MCPGFPTTLFFMTRVCTARPADVQEPRPAADLVLQETAGHAEGDAGAEFGGPHHLGSDPGGPALISQPSEQRGFADPGWPLHHAHAARARSHVADDLPQLRTLALPLHQPHLPP